MSEHNILYYSIMFQIFQQTCHYNNKKWCTFLIGWKFHATENWITSYLCENYLCTSTKAYKCNTHKHKQVRYFTSHHKRRRKEPLLKALNCEVTLACVHSDGPSLWLIIMLPLGSRSANSFTVSNILHNSEHGGDRNIHWSLNQEMNLGIQSERCYVINHNHNSIEMLTFVWNMYYNEGGFGDTFRQVFIYYSYILQHPLPWRNKCI